MNSRIEKPFLLFVEGKDDKAVVEMLLKFLTIESVHVYDAKGRDNIRREISAVTVQEGFDEIVRAVGIVRDADDDCDGAAQSCLDILAGISKRTRFTVLADEGRGMLEDVCLRSLAGRIDLSCVDRYVECIRATGITLTNPAKFRMRALLTALDDGKNRDTWWAVGERLLDPAHEAFGPLREFLVDFTGA